jgi:hypothetical protein
MSAMNDTSPEIAEMVRARLMALSGAERFVMGTRMFDAARRMVLASLPESLSEAERKRQLFTRFYGKALPEEAFEKIQGAGQSVAHAGTANEGSWRDAAGGGDKTSDPKKRD